MSYFPLLLLAESLTLTLAAAGPDPRIGKEITVPELGLKMRTFRDSSSTVMPSLTRLPGTKDGKPEDFVIFSNAWRHPQMKGCYAGESGALFVLAPLYKVPDAPPQHMAESDFKKWTEENKLASFPDKLKPWLEYFFETSFQKADAQLKGQRNITLDLYEPSDLKSDGLYIMKAFEKTSGRQILLAFKFEPGTEDKKIRRFLASSAETISFTKISAPTEAKTMDVTSKKNSRNTAERSEKYKASREAVIKNIANAESWWYAETENYILASNIKKRRDAQVIAEEAEKIRALFEKTMPPPTPIDDVSVIRVFDDRNEYNRYLGEGYEWTAGIWMPSKKELVFFLDGNSRSKKEARNNVSNVLYHELFHQYCHYSSGQMSAFPWFNEGNAQVFQDVTMKPNGKFGFDIPQQLIQRKVKNILASKYTNVENIVNLGFGEFNDERDFSYDATWLLMVFMLKHCPAKPELKDYSEIPQKYFMALAETQDERKAHEAAWKDVDMKEISKAFREFLGNRSSVTRAVSSTNMAPISTGKIKDL